MLKSFDDFLATLSEDDIADIANTANIQMQKVQSETPNPQNILGNQVAACSFVFTQEMLRHYHEWLSLQID